jgi:hypothetical protein
VAGETYGRIVEGGINVAYFSNSTDGDILQQQCDECPLGREGMHCPAFLVQSLHNYDQVGNEKLKSAMELLIDKKGECQLRKEVLKLEIKEEKHWLERFDEESSRKEVRNGNED